MKGLLILLIHLVVVLARLAQPSGTRALVTENLLMKQQSLILGRSRRRAPNLRPADRMVLALCTLFVSPRRLPKVAAGVRPSTLHKLHQCLARRKYRALFSAPRSGKTPGPKGPPPEIVGKTPAEISEDRDRRQADVRRYRWKSHCRGLYALPIAA